MSSSARTAWRADMAPGVCGIIGGLNDQRVSGLQVVVGGLEGGETRKRGDAKKACLPVRVAKRRV